MDQDKINYWNKYSNIVSDPACPTWRYEKLTVVQKLRQYVGLPIKRKKERAVYLIANTKTIICSPENYSILKEK